MARAHTGGVVYAEYESGGQLPIRKTTKTPKAEIKQASLNSYGNP